MKKFFNCASVLVCVLVCALCMTACASTTIVTRPQRVHLTLSDKVHVEYQGTSFTPSGVLVKDGDLYYVKAATVYSSDRLEVMVKENLQNAQYERSFISARWADLEGGAEAWQMASDDTNYDGWHANEIIRLLATYFPKTETMQDYLILIGRWPAPDFSSYR